MASVLRNEFEIDGLKEVDKALNALSGKDLANLYKSYNRQALKNYVLNPLKSGLPYSHEKLANFKIVAGKGNKTALLAGPTSGDKDPPGNTYVLRYVEGGTQARYNSRGAYRGRIFANKKIEPIADSGAREIIGYTSKNYGEEINKILVKKLKRVKRG